jgi:hypothetical protein
LLFGVAPGLAGAVLPVATVPDSSARDLTAMKALSDGRALVVRYYMAFTGVRAVDERALRSTRSLAVGAARRGLFTDVVIRYMPSDGGDPAAVQAYARFIRHVVDVLGPSRRLLDLQVTNEVNVSLSANTSDGVFKYAKDALIIGVEAAKQQTNRDGFRGLGIGFNWFYRMDPNTEDSFWSYLGTHGGAAFQHAVDWVGLDAYPGTWFPPAPADERDAMINALSVLRGCFMPAAGLGSRARIHVVENGWATGPGRPESLQRTALREMIGAIEDYRGNYGVTDYRWFDLRDSNSNGPDFEQHFGIEYDNYTPKPAFAAYRTLIASLDRRVNAIRPAPRRRAARSPSR